MAWRFRKHWAMWFGLCLAAFLASPSAALQKEGPVAGASLQTDVDYSVGPGDVLKISVYRAPDLETVVKVSKDGFIVMGAIGQVAVSGMSPSAIGQRIASRLTSGGIFLNPIVNVIVQEYHSKSISILGAVARPGEYPIDREGMKLSDMLARAGADLGGGGGAVRILNDSSGVSGAEEINTVDIVSGTRDRAVQPHDTIYVKPAPTFYISGEVQRAGAYPVEPGLTVERAIALAGGLSPRGSRNKIKITRKQGDGQADQVIKAKAGSTVAAFDLIVVGARIF